MQLFFPSFISITCSLTVKANIGEVGTTEETANQGKHYTHSHTNTPSETQTPEMCE